MSWDERMHPRADDGRFGHIAAGPADARQAARAGRAADVAVKGRVLSQRDFTTETSDTTEDVADRAAENLAARWDVTDDDLTALAKEDGVTLRGDTPAARRESMARLLIHGWNGASGSAPARIAIDAVRKDLGLPDHNNEQTRGVFAWAAAHPPIERALASFGRAMYAETQRWLADRGLNEVSASRAGFGDDQQRPFTSWALDHGGMRHEAGRVVRHETIPARLVMSVPPTGFGTLAESELVVLPGW